MGGDCQTNLTSPLVSRYIIYLETAKTARVDMRKKVTFFGFLLTVFILADANGQDNEKIKRLFEGAIQAMGGDAYLSVSDIVSDGNYFMFDRDGNSSGLIKYNDYTKLPDKSRFELGNKKKERDVTVFNLEKNEGWILEGQKDTRAATKDEMNGFRSDVKHSIENIFRSRYGDPQNKYFYLGAGEGLDVTLEMVQILDPENDTITVYFDRASKLPAKVEYQRVNQRGIKEKHIQEFGQWHNIQGINTPLRLDGYVNGRKAFQSFAVKINYNNNLPDSLFSKPIPPE